jgi:hypothetical protein
VWLSFDSHKARYSHAPGGENAESCALLPIISSDV